MLKTNEHLEQAKKDLNRIESELLEISQKVKTLQQYKVKLEKEIKSFNPENIEIPEEVLVPDDIAEDETVELDSPAD